MILLYYQALKFITDNLANFARFKMQDRLILLCASNGWFCRCKFMYAKYWRRKWFLFTAYYNLEIDFFVVIFIHFTPKCNLKPFQTFSIHFLMAIHTVCLHLRFTYIFDTEVRYAYCYYSLSPNV